MAAVTVKSLQWLVILGLALHASALSKCILLEVFTYKWAMAIAEWRMGGHVNVWLESVCVTGQTKENKCIEI